MTPFALAFTKIASTGTLLMGILFLGLLFLYVYVRFADTPSSAAIRMFNVVGAWSYPIAFIVTLGAVVGSEVYSEIIGFLPCIFCWYQRIFMFPLPVILAIAMYKKNDRGAADYVFGLSVIGGAIALYQYYGQMWNESALPCGALGVSCATRPFVDYGYITIPMMALTVFALVAILMLIRKMYVMKSST